MIVNTRQLIDKQQKGNTLESKFNLPGINLEVIQLFLIIRPSEGIVPANNELPMEHQKI